MKELKELKAWMEMKNINEMKEMKAWIDMKIMKKSKGKERIERIESLDGNEKYK